MTGVRKIRNGPATRGLLGARPGGHPSRVDAKKQERLRRIGLYVRAERKKKGVDSQKELAEVLDMQISAATVQAVESGRKSVAAQSYATLEDWIGIPIGTLERYLSGDLRELPGSERIVDSGEVELPERFEAGKETFTREELRTLVKALGPKAFIDWAAGPEGAGDEGP